MHLTSARSESHGLGHRSTEQDRLPAEASGESEGEGRRRLGRSGEPRRAQTDSECPSSEFLCCLCPPQSKSARSVSDSAAHRRSPVGRPRPQAGPRARPVSVRLCRCGHRRPRLQAGHSAIIAVSVSMTHGGIGLQTTGLNSGLRTLELRDWSLHLQTTCHNLNNRESATDGPAPSRPAEMGRSV
jgi:hypothetical protein